VSQRIKTVLLYQNEQYTVRRLVQAQFFARPMTKKTALPRHEMAQCLPPGLNAVKKKWCGVGRSPNTTPRPYTRVQLKLKKSQL
jgi:hypothetical protein